MTTDEIINKNLREITNYWDRIMKGLEPYPQPTD